MRLSRDKVNRLAHSVADALATLDDVEFIEDPNSIRMEARRILEELLNAEAKIDQAARAKIETQKRTITEGCVNCPSSFFLISELTAMPQNNLKLIVKNFFGFCLKSYNSFWISKEL